MNNIKDKLAAGLDRLEKLVNALDLKDPYELTGSDLEITEDENMPGFIVGKAWSIAAIEKEIPSIVTGKRGLYWQAQQLVFQDGLGVVPDDCDVADLGEPQRRIDDALLIIMQNTLQVSFESVADKI